MLIGDPKQAIYAFRGGDVATYLQPRPRAATSATLDTNWRSDRPLVEAIHAVLRGASLGDDRIVVRDVHAHHHGPRLAGRPRNDPFRLRLVTRQQCGVPPQHGRSAIDRLRDHDRGRPRRRRHGAAGQRRDVRRASGRGR